MYFGKFPLQLVLDFGRPPIISQKVIETPTNQRVEPVQLTVADDRTSEGQTLGRVFGFGRGKEASERSGWHQMAHIASKL